MLRCWKGPAANLPGRRLRLFQGDYLQQDFGEEEYDAAISFQTMHHFSPDRKRDLYARVLRALKRGGVYLEGDHICLLYTSRCV